MAKAATLVLAIAGIIGISSAPASAASGGGCGAWVASGAYHLQACISMDHITVLTSGRLVVYGPPAPGCKVDITAYADGQFAGLSSYTCAGSDHTYAGNSWWSGNASAQTVAELKLNGATVLTAYSKVQYT